jgi:hypothetical protein
LQTPTSNDVWTLVVRIGRGILDAWGTRLVERRLRRFVRVVVTFTIVSFHGDRFHARRTRTDPH